MTSKKLTRNDAITYAKYLNFSKVFTHFSKEEANLLKNQLQEALTFLETPQLLNAIYTVLNETIMNASKAMYKHLYRDHLMKKISMVNQSNKMEYKDWLVLFNTEFEKHQFDNLIPILEATDKRIHMEWTVQEETWLLAISNEGIPLPDEWERIHYRINLVKEARSLSTLLEKEDPTKEVGGGLGIGMILMILDGISISMDHFSITAKDNTTTSNITLPWSIFNKQS